MTTLRNFIVSERDLLMQFENYWNYMNQQNPEDYPINLDYDQWVKQFQIFCRGHK